MRFLLAAAIGLLAVTTAVGTTAQPIIIGHRGAAGERPEHTLESYRTAIAGGADFIEPDLVPTKDGVLVARHENEIGGTTDVASHPEFTARHATKTIDGTRITGWFTEDFTLAELKTLRARERLPALRRANTAWDGKFDIPTFAEILALAKSESARTGRTIGVYPETKHPSYFTAIGLPLERKLVDALTAAGYTKKTDAAFIQSFEVANLKALRTMTGLRLIQLVDEGHPADDATTTYDAMMTPAGLQAIALYADGIGPAKARIIPRDASGSSLAPTHLVADAHAAGLLVHPYTFRSENEFLPAELRRGTDPAAHGDAAAEYRMFFAAGVDGLFSDFADEAFKARTQARRD
ncbi:MAG: glycerophosphodiester phosphodiesterase [Janthinobacterium lividum]